MPDPSTVWRRQKRKAAGDPVNERLGRRTLAKAEKERREAADYVARLACARRMSGDRIDARDLKSYRHDKLSRGLRDLLIAVGYSAGLLYVAAADTLRLADSRRKRGSPRRGQVRNRQTLWEQLTRTYRITHTEAAKMLFVDTEKNEPWLKKLIETREDDSLGQPSEPSLSRGCPSRIFPISSRMVAYWRREEMDYGLVCQTLGRVAYSQMQTNESLLAHFRQCIKSARTAE